MTVASELTRDLEDEELRRKVTEIIIADIKALGPIRMALVGIFPDEQRQPAEGGEK